MVNKNTYLEECGQRPLCDHNGGVARQLSFTQRLMGQRLDEMPKISVLAYCPICRMEWREIYQLVDLEMEENLES